MYILTQDGTQVLDADKVERFCVSVMSDCDRIVASYSDIRPPVTIARYAKSEHAGQYLFNLLTALSAGEKAFCMPLSVLQAEERHIHDTRQKRKGGS